MTQKREVVFVYVFRIPCVCLQQDATGTLHSTAERPQGGLSLWEWTTDSKTVPSNDELSTSASQAARHRRIKTRSGRPEKQDEMSIRDEAVLGAYESVAPRNEPGLIHAIAWPQICQFPVHYIGDLG